jgi:hypothetical protein
MRITTFRILYSLTVNSYFTVVNQMKELGLLFMEQLTFSTAFVVSFSQVLVFGIVDGLLQEEITTS